MNKFVKISGILLAIGFTIIACNKTSSNTKKLDGGEWQITQLSVDGMEVEELPHWVIAECDPYEETCTGQWLNDEGGEAKFAWQFNDKGKVFEIANQSELLEEDEHEHGEHEAAMQCQYFSGAYQVVEQKKKAMKFESSTTLGYSGKKVVLAIEKK
jgi:hypothetical protein